MKGIVLDEPTKTYRVYPNNCVARFAEATKTDVTNHASFGMTTVKAQERILRSLERTPPAKDDIIVVEFGGNDCDYSWREISERPQDHHEPRTPIEAFEERFKSILDAFLSLGHAPILISLPPLEPNRYLDWISQGLSRENILSWLGDVNKIYRWQEAYNEIVIEAAREKGLRLVNARKGFLESDDFTALICADGIHPNERGHQCIFGSFMDFVSGL
jgi:acyl-CoA thioesterase I